MAMNPMQRRSRNSFLLGFILAIIIGAIAVFVLYNMMDSIKKEKEAIEALRQEVYVAVEDIKSGDKIYVEGGMIYIEKDGESEKEKNKVIDKEKVITTLDASELISLEDFIYTEDDGNTYSKSMVLKIDVPAGTVITRDMLEEADTLITSDQRLQEYNMIILPTLLEEGDYIDIRLQLPTGEDYIVVSKKQVVRSTTDTVWLKMREDEILTLGNSIVEAYTITGSKLYATYYTQPGLQEAATPTYQVSDRVLLLMNQDSNLINEAIEGLNKRYNSEQRNVVRNSIDETLSEFQENMNELVETGLQEEITKLQEAREEYVEALEGTGVVEAE